MNDQHPHAGYAGYDGYSTGSLDTGSFETGSFETDPLFGALPGTGAGYDGAYDASYDTSQGYGIPYTGGETAYGAYDTTQWDTGAHHGYQAQQHPQYETAQYDTTTAWLPDGYSSGQWDTTTWTAAGPAWPSDDTGTYDTGVYDATAWNTGATPGHEEQNVQSPAASNEAEQPEPPETYETYESYENGDYDPYEPHRRAADGTEPDEAPEPHPDLAPVEPRRGGRSRRRSPAKRSALLTVAVPSACVMSVAGIAAASVSGMGGDETKKDATTTMAAADPGTVKPVAANNELDTQLANLSADAENFADRASRTQERIDLKERQAAEKKKREEEAARKEALRPKFVMPVKQHGLSAYFGQAGVNWMSVHTGIDFPVQYGTPVMAATDGTVRTQYNTAYGNMAIVTMADGTETWYCHLSSTRIRSGPVKAGDVIAYSGSSGNSTGPHMHFEVRPGGGAAIDPLPWLRGHGINPT
ncbi:MULTISPECIES: M23 family metallopeptidase [unclassified Streptomyces]|uniref:M23 family metallopeptidase n=1 Tax=unclassified Streptomyces TaxID=2593676 RepID=UPI000365E9C8|nr:MULTISPECIES: M23 family metallopeptidase [unclassified Streptomyces]MYQ77994.1 peptidoglycan DD-metalloendopeptidase family protein [Streptomyces sp. SID4923]